MAGFQCGSCGKLHDHLPRDLAYERPASYFGVPEPERERRVRISNDLCSIDDEHFFIRGVLYLPIHQSDEQFGWGVWVEVMRADFDQYVSAWKRDVEDTVPAFPGLLDGGVQPYPESDRLEVWVKLRSGGQRPVFTVVSEEHPLGVDQRAGISEERAHSFVARLL